MIMGGQEVSASAGVANGVIASSLMKLRLAPPGASTIDMVPHVLSQSLH